MSSDGRRNTRLRDGISQNAHKRRTVWLKARIVRTQLHPVSSQREVADFFGISPQAVEQIELRALSKIIESFKLELHECQTNGR